MNTSTPDSQAIAAAVEVDAPTARSFVSRFLAKRLCAGDPPQGPERFDVSAAVLLTDIVGFTAHVEQVAETGRAGLEQLAAEVNAYVVAVTSTVEEYGGDVIAIAGDSFLGLWPAGETIDLSAATRLAATAASYLQERIRALPSQGGTALRTRAGLAAGPVVLGLLGGLDGRWDLAAAGPAVEAAAHAERLGRPGEVTVAAAAIPLLGDDAVSDPVTDGLVELRAASASALLASAVQASGLPAVAAPPEPGVERLRPFVPAPVLAGATVDSEWLAEFRSVTVVMAKVEEREDLEPERRLDRSQRRVRAFQELITRFGGSTKLSVDNKGLTHSSVFGLPPHASGDVVERALRGARAVHQALSADGARCTVGVATGRSFCGVFGSAIRREYSLFGDVVNLASRLSNSGAGEVLIDETSASASALVLELEARPKLLVRGRRRKMAIQALLGIERAPVLARGMINRDDERSLITSRMGDVLATGRNATVVLSGEPGIGKSTLARDAVRLATDAGMRCFEVVTDAVDRSTAYGPWRALVDELLAGRRSTESLVAALDPDGAASAEELARLLPLLSPLLSGAPAENATTAGMSGEARRDQLNGLITRAITRVSRTQPVLLLVEDAQWLDSTSWSLLLRVSAEIPRLLLIVTERRATSVEPPQPEREELLQLPAAEEILVGNLSSQDTENLILRRLGVPAVPREVLELILERVAGHPFFCEAVLQDMVVSGNIRIGEDRAELAPKARVDVPTSVESAVLGRVDRLGLGHAMTLKVASVVGRAFTGAEVAAAHPSADEATVEEHLRTLAELELIDPERSSQSRAFAFRHQIVRDVAYELLTEAQRRPLHLNLAVFYESSRDEHHLRVRTALLGHHFLRAAEPRRALPYLEQAGAAALREGAFQEAVDLLDQAIGHLPLGQEIRRARLEKSLADAHYFLGNMVGARALLELSLERLGHPLPKAPSTASRALLKELVLARRAAAGRHLSRESRTSGDSTLGLAVEAHRVLVQISYLHATSALELCYLIVRAHNLGRQFGPSPELARALADAAALLSIFGMHRLGDRYATQASEMSEHEDHAPAAAYVWNILAIMYAGRGEWSRALEANGRALELFGELGDYNLEAELWQTRSAIQLSRGDMDGAETAWLRTRELAERKGSSTNMCWSLLDEVQTCLGRDEVEAAGPVLERALAIPTPQSDGGTVIERHATTAWARWRQGRYAEAMLEAEAVLAMAAKGLPTGWVWAEMTVQAVEVLLEIRADPHSGVPPARLDLPIRRGLRILTRLGMTFAGIRGRNQVLRARAALQRGERSRATSSLRLAARAARRPDQQRDRALVALVRAELLPPQSRRRELDPAIGVLEELGLRADLARAEALAG